MAALELGTVLCTKCYSVPKEPCRENSPDGWAFRDRIHLRRRRAQIQEMPEYLSPLVAGKQIGLRAKEVKEALEEGTFPLPLVHVGRRLVVARKALLDALREPRTT
ncbi:hypothetical protein [Actinoplanes sp. NPDC051859]|uniref:hypothetical protein n=1 Tax=Actinoplanes sp. NPDC051859 TaxID=3363909 RepID=UPI0037BAAD4F